MWFWNGAVLLQEGRPIAFESRGMTSAKCKDHIGEQELLGVVHAYARRAWRCYLEGPANVTVVTDHNPITYLQTPPVLSRRQARWLQTFKFKWLYKPIVFSHRSCCVSRAWLAELPVTSTR